MNGAAAARTPSERHLAETWAGARDLGVAFLHGGGLVAVVSGLYVLSVGATLGTRVEAGFLAVVVLGVAAVYGFNHLVELRGDAATNPERTVAISARKGLHAALFLASVVGSLVVPVIADRAGALGWVGTLLGLGLLYSLGGKGLTRSVPAFKSVYVGGMFAALVPFCAAYHEVASSVGIVAITLLVGLDNAQNATFCDLKDARSDAAAGLRTLPAILGREGARRVLGVANATWCGLLVAGVWARRLPVGALALLSIGVLRAICLRAARGADEPALRRLSVVADLDGLVCWGSLGIAWLAIPNSLPVPPWPSFPALGRLPWGTASRTPLIGDEVAGSLACAALALALGAALRYVDRARESDGAPRRRAPAVFAAGALVAVALMGLNACFATIALSLVIGAAAAGAVRTPVHLAGGLLVAAICVAFQGPRLELGALAVLGAAAAADELLLRARLRRPSADVLAAVLRHRPLWKASLLALTFAAGWPVRYAVAAVAFDVGYALLDRSLATTGRQVGGVAR